MFTTLQEADLHRARRNDGAMANPTASGPPHPAVVQGRLSRSPCACGGSCPRCQAKSALKVGAPDDAFEREADAVADQVMRMESAAHPFGPAPSGVQRKCTQCEKESEAPLLQPRSASAGASASAPAAPASVDAVLGSTGRALDAQTRAFFEPRFARDFSGVQVHADSAAAQSARDVNAHAYTVGQHIVFNTGRFTPGTREGRHLLSHELAHVVQQSGVGSQASNGYLRRQLDDSDGGTPGTADSGAPGSYDGDSADVEIPPAPPSSREAGGDAAVSAVPTVSGTTAEITLETGNTGAGFLNNLVHQQVCVDRPSRAKRCYSFAATGAQAPQFSSTWLGWDSWVTGAILQGQVYDPAPVSGASIVSTHTPTVAQADNWVTYMDGSRLGLQDGYSVARHNCRLFSQWEFRDAPSHW
ncbi:DUF4157 domain-containing protein [Pseudomonas sp. BN417]|uniref:eCIS core domain-containing protein n=1 Tax=Pseudomonas sp. BN417 TaxID=2567890 RepID=UPI00245646ED|nr:DUF4157 domain-containing protein [Pseudomonas sp. BN417]